MLIVTASAAKRETKDPMIRVRPIVTISVLFACLAAGTRAQDSGASLALSYNSETRGPVPVPPSERSLQTVVAEPWFKVSRGGMVLEGPAFERNGNLLFCDVSGHRVLRLTPGKRLSTVTTLDDIAPGGIAIHKDGQMFIAALNLVRGIRVDHRSETGWDGEADDRPRDGRLYAE